ncbi:hypothetical protein STEG23_005157, partial [Scotinomys teguina]
GGGYGLSDNVNYFVSVPKLKSYYIVLQLQWRKVTSCCGIVLFLQSSVLRYTLERSLNQLQASTKTRVRIPSTHIKHQDFSSWERAAHTQGNLMGNSWKCDTQSLETRGLCLVKIFSVVFWRKVKDVVTEMWDDLLVFLVSVGSFDPRRRKHSVHLSLWIGQGRIRSSFRVGTDLYSPAGSIYNAEKSQALTAVENLCKQLLKTGVGLRQASDLCEVTFCSFDAVPPMLHTPY